MFERNMVLYADDHGAQTGAAGNDLRRSSTKLHPETPTAASFGMISKRPAIPAIVGRMTYNPARNMQDEQE